MSLLQCNAIVKMIISLNYNLNCCFYNLVVKAGRNSSRNIKETCK